MKTIKELEKERYRKEIIKHERNRILKLIDEIKPKDICCVYIEGDDPEACTHGMKAIEELKQKIEEKPKSRWGRSY